MAASIQAGLNRGAPMAFGVRGSKCEGNCGQYLPKE